MEMRRMKCHPDGYDAYLVLGVLPPFLMWTFLLRFSPSYMIPRVFLFKAMTDLARKLIIVEKFSCLANFCGWIW